MKETSYQLVPLTTDYKLIGLTSFQSFQPFFSLAVMAKATHYFLYTVIRIHTGKVEMSNFLPKIASFLKCFAHYKISIQSKGAALIQFI